MLPHLNDQLDVNVNHHCTGIAIQRASVLRLRVSSIRSTNEAALGRLPLALLSHVDERAAKALAVMNNLLPAERVRLVSATPP